MGRIYDCPICRQPIAVSPEVRVERLLRLVARSPGRHTPFAQLRLDLGTMYANFKWYRGPAGLYRGSQLYRLAADQGDASVLCNLGLMYHNGTGVPQDFTEAARLCRLAADQGHAHGQCNLGAMYTHNHHSTGVPLDFTEAARLLKLACDPGSPPPLNHWYPPLGHFLFRAQDPTTTHLQYYTPIPSLDAAIQHKNLFFFLLSEPASPARERIRRAGGGNHSWVALTRDTCIEKR